jgi:hypothetical protein
LSADAANAKTYTDYCEASSDCSDTTSHCLGGI